MDVYTIILEHYYNYFMQFTSCFHCCKTVHIDCISECYYEQPCLIIEKENCQNKESCQLKEICINCEALKKSDFLVLAKYFNRNDTVVLNDNLVCYGDRVPCLIKLSESPIHLSPDNQSREWIIGKVLVMCVFTNQHSCDSELLKGMVSLFCETSNYDENSAEQDFMDQFEKNKNEIPESSQLGIMLIQAIDKLNIYNKNKKYIELSAVTMIIVNKLQKIYNNSRSKSKFS